jgi:hypothetical protein
LNTPIKGFWLLVKNLTPLRAEEEARQLDLLLSANSNNPEGIQELRHALQKEAGFDPAQASMNAELDREGLNELRTM